MPILDRCWTPFMVYSWTSVKYGSYYSAGYTACMHFLFIFYAIYVMMGGRSDQFYTPYFELDKKGTVGAAVFTIIFSILFLGASAMLASGVRKTNRCMFFPWLMGMVLEILLMAAIGIWFIARYYNNLYSILAAFVLWCFDGLHVYCFLCVLSEYQVLRDIQEPRFIILYP